MESHARSSKKARQCGSGTGLAELAARLTKRLADENASRNLVYSPLSIYAAELEDFVSRTTEEALQDRSGSGGPSVAFACGVWREKTRPLKPAYRDAVVGAPYNAEARAVDFRRDTKEARRQINAWVAEVARNLITDVVAPGRSISLTTPTTDVVLANAMYFKGKWKNLPFHGRDTTNKPFHRLDGSAVVDVPFMKNSSRRHYFIAVHDGFKVLKLQYKMSSRDDVPYFRTNNSKKPTQHSLCIFLPDAHDGLWSLVGEISSRPSFLHEHLPERNVEVGHVGVPNFKLSFSSDVIESLKYLGLLLPFNIEADLSGMVEDDGSGLPLLVHDVFHKAVIEVNEEGTKAAAVTLVRPLPGGGRIVPAYGRWVQLNQMEGKVATYYWTRELRHEE